MKNSLYNSDNRLTTEGTNLTIEVNKALRDIFSSYVAKGYSPREISHIMISDVMDLEYQSSL